MRVVEPPAFRIPLHKLIRVVRERLPNLNERFEDVPCNSMFRSKCAEDCATADERLEVRSIVLGKKPDDFVRETLLVADPFEKLRLERLNLAFGSPKLLENILGKQARLWQNGKGAHEGNITHIPIWDIGIHAVTIPSDD
jgi:hypothetical protein